MDCSSARQHCQPHLDGELSAEQAAQLQSHLDACRCCADQFQHQKQFHGLVRRTLVQASASAVLRQRITTVIAHSAVVNEVARAAAAQPQSRAAAAGVAVKAPKPAAMRSIGGFPTGGSVAAAAVLMLSLAGWIGLYAVKLCPQCPVVVAAQNAHDRIAAAVPSTLLDTDDPVKLTRHINNTLRVLPGFAGVPNLSDCQLKAVNCGAIEIEGLPPGVFIKFVECKCEEEPITLLVLNTASLPDGQEDHGFITSSYSHHNLVSWKSEKDGLLYMLVTKLPLKDVMDVAVVARR